MGDHLMTASLVEVWLHCIFHFFFLLTKSFMYFTSFREGLCVVKVFAIQDPSLPLKTYQDQLTDIKNRLATAPNVLPFHHSILTDKASLLMRQFIKDNLYDRIRQVFLNFWLWDPGWALTLCLFIVSILWIKVLQCGSKGKVSITPHHFMVMKLGQALTGWGFLF